MFFGAAVGALLIQHSLALELGLAAFITLTAMIIQCFRGDTMQELTAASHK
jgi:hypothetical protein